MLLLFRKGQNALKPFSSLAAAEKEFAKKFKDKTGNVWSLDIYEEGAFVVKPNKYTLIDLHEVFIVLIIWGFWVLCCS